MAEGDEVLYSQYGATEIEVDGEQLIVLSESDVLFAASGSSERHVLERPTLGSAAAGDVAELRDGVAEAIERLRELAR